MNKSLFLVLFALISLSRASDVENGKIDDRKKLEERNSQVLIKNNQQKSEKIVNEIDIDSQGGFPKNQIQDEVEMKINRIKDGILIEEEYTRTRTNIKDANIEKLLALNHKLEGIKNHVHGDVEVDHLSHDANIAHTRKAIDPSNVALIEKLNSDAQGKATYGANKFSYMPITHFKKHYFTKNWFDITPYQKYHVFGHSETDVAPPESKIDDEVEDHYFNWADRNAVTPVKDQGQCGSCWAFSATGTIEGHYALLHNRLISLSEQELLDCDESDNACEGGLPINAFYTIEKLGGIETEEEYPYHPYETKCAFKKGKVAVKVLSEFTFEPHDEELLKRHLRRHGPISIGINAENLPFYTNGIHGFSECDPTMLNHGVLLVGYGKEKEVKYWIVKNSWGPDWGEKGFFRLLRGNNTCGVSEMASSVIVG